MVAKRLALVRHGEAEGAGAPRFGDRSDAPLSQRGVLQAELTREYLRALAPVSAIYTSPLAVCQQTAHIIAASYDVGPIYSPDLRELDYGRWQGQLYDDVAHADPERFNAWMALPHKATIPEGEDLVGADRRASHAWRTALARDPEGMTILVSHSSIIRLLLLNILSVSPAHYWELAQSSCGVSMVTHQGTRWVIASMNETAHLSSERRIGGHCRASLLDAKQRVAG